MATDSTDSSSTSFINLLPPSITCRIIVELLHEDIRVLCALLCTSKGMAVEVQSAVQHLHQLRTSTNAEAVAKHRGPGSTVILPPLLSHLSALQHLDLSNAFSCVDDGCLHAIACHCKQLHALQLRYCQKITAAGLQDMAQAGLPKLQELSLEHCGDIGSGAFLGLLPHLQRLNANYCHTLAPAAVCEVAARLTELQVQSCELIDDSVCEGMCLIQRLNIARTAVGDQGLWWLQQCQHLQHLVVAHRSNNIWTDCAWSDAALSHFEAARPDVVVHHSWAL